MAEEGDVRVLCQGVSWSIALSDPVARDIEHAVPDPAESDGETGGQQGESRLWDRREVVAWAKVWRREKPWR